jgi:uncharacterized membrane protein YgcG
MVKWIIAVLLLFAVSLSAAPPKAHRQRIVVLHPSAEAEVIANVRIVEWSDGRREIVRSLPEALNPTDEVQAISWTYDLGKGTYTSKRVQPSQQALERAAARRRQRGQGRFRIAAQDEAGLMKRSFLYSVETWEPGAHLGAQSLNRTEMEMAWSECSDGWSMQLDRFDGRCRANPDTFVNTTWYVDSCYKAPPSSRAGAFFASVNGEYHNDDFGFDSLPTSVSVQINAYVTRGLTPSVSHTYQNWGEGTLLIHDVSEYWPEAWPGSNCAGTTTGGGGSEPGGGDGGGGDGGTGGGGGDGGDDDDITCLLVTDGSTGELLGICCGDTTESLINCAGQYAN